MAANRKLSGICMNGIVSIFKFPVLIVRLNLRGRQIAFSVVTIKAAAFSNKLQNAIIFVFDTFRIVFFVSLIPKEFSVLPLKMRYKMSIQAKPLKSRIVRDIQTGIPVLLQTPEMS